MSENKKNNKLLENPVIVGLLELAIFYFGATLYSIVTLMPLLLFKRIISDKLLLNFVSDFIENGFFIIVILLCLLFMKKTNPKTLGVFSKGTFTDRIRTGLCGALIGFCANAVISLIAVFSGTVTVSFHAFSIFLIAIIPTVFIQCTMEEVLCRGFVPEYLKKYNDPVIIAVSGICFILHHIGNLSIDGFNGIFCLNVFLLGTVMYLLVVVSGNFWIACGFHTAWNYTQQYLFGLPNSGITSSYGLFQGKAAESNFFFNATYGNEGSLTTTILSAIIIVILLILRLKKKDPNLSSHNL